MFAIFARSDGFGIDIATDCEAANEKFTRSQLKRCCVVPPLTTTRGWQPMSQAIGYTSNHHDSRSMSGRVAIYYKRQLHFGLHWAIVCGCKPVGS